MCGRFTLQFGLGIIHPMSQLPRCWCRRCGGGLSAESVMKVRMRMRALTSWSAPEIRPLWSRP